MKKWKTPEITALSIDMTENGHNHKKWAEYSRSENSQSGYYVPRPSVDNKDDEGTPISEIDSQS